MVEALGAWGARWIGYLGEEDRPQPVVVDVCDTDPGYDVSVTVTVNLRCMTRIWRGDLSWSDALRSGTIALHGPNALRQALPHWFTPATFASVPRAPSTYQHHTDRVPRVR